MFLLLIKFFVLWFALSIFIAATAWYIRAFIKWFWPDWWRREIIDEWPKGKKYF
jgi:hypothetical protein